MRRALSLVSLLSVLVTACASHSADEAPAKGAAKQEPAEVEAAEESPVVGEQEPSAAVAAYQAAILADRGDQAVSLVTQSTIERFGEFRRAALSEEREALRARPAMDELIVLLMRHRIPTDQLAAFDARGVLIHAFEQGWVGKKSVENATFGEPEIDGDLAHVPLLDETGEPTPMRFELRREGGGWKLDITALMQQTQGAMKTFLEGIDPDPEQAMLKLLSMATGSEFDATAWDPPRPD